MDAAKLMTTDQGTSVTAPTTQAPGDSRSSQDPSDSSTLPRLNTDSEDENHAARNQPHRFSSNRCQPMVSNLISLPLRHSWQLATSGPPRSDSLHQNR